MIELDGTSVREAVRPVTDDARFRKAIDNLAGDRLLLSLFLMNVSHGEGVGEAGVAAIGQDETAALLHEVRRTQGIDRRSTESTKLVVEELFPEFFDHGQYRYEDVVGRDYYFTVREANRRRLRERGRYSRLNLFLTTSFAHEVTIGLLYGAVVDALARSPLPRELAARVADVLAGIRRDEAAGELVAQHNALLAAPRDGLSPSALEALDTLARLTAADYECAAELAVREIVAAYAPWADAEAARRRVLGRV
jgi:hypothetical protein